MSGDRQPTGFEVACQLAEFGAAMVAEKHRREHPEATEDEVDAAVGHWWGERPGAPDGDAPGAVRRPAS